MAGKIVQTAGRDQLGEFAPAFAHYNDDVLFGENWNDPGLGVKTRCLITVVALMAQGITDSSLAYHIANAKAHGVTRDEMAAAITHVAFYAGWPKAWAAFNLARGVYVDDASAAESAEGKDRYQASVFFPVGEPNPYGRYFTGQSYLAQLSGGQIPLYNVTFEPGCRNFWHIHRAESGGGQVLVCVGGRGFYREWGEPPQEMTPGTVVDVPAGVKHWHGAAPDSWFSHLAIEVPGEGASSEWLEPVSDEEYGEFSGA